MFQLALGIRRLLALEEEKENIWTFLENLQQEGMIANRRRRIIC
jgi:hypothetical protein